MKRLLREEKGSVFIIVLVLLVVGGLVLTPLLGLMSTGLMSGQVYEKKAHEYYAADSGVEDAIWQITRNDTLSYPYQYQFTVDGRTVGVAIDRYDWDPTCGENLTYNITSIAATDASGSTAATDTRIDAHLVVSYMDFSSLLDYAIISDSTIGMQPNNYVDGDVWLPDEDDLNNRGEIDGEVKDEDDVSITWPTVGQLRDYYLDDVEDADDPSQFINIANRNAVGPAYRAGDLAIDNTGAGNSTLVLTGTIYIDGNLHFEQPGGHEYTVDLNGQTIFVEGTIAFPANHVNISGSGCIIAVGNIDFQPGIASDGDDFVLVMSITDYVEFHPSGDFTGCIAGNAHVQLQPGCTINWISSEGKGLNFPVGVPPDLDDLPPATGVSIISWEIS